MNKKLMFGRLLVMFVLVGLIIQFLLKIDLTPHIIKLILIVSFLVGFLSVFVGVPVCLGVLAQAILPFKLKWEGIIYLISSGFVVGFIEICILHSLVSITVTNAYLHSQEMFVLYFIFFLIGYIAAVVGFYKYAIWPSRK